MYYVISKSTDLRCLDTQIKKFTSIVAAKRYASIGQGKFTHKNPKEANNYHHTYNYVYELTGRINKKDKIFKDKGSPTYPKTYNDNLAEYIRTYGIELSN